MTTVAVTAASGCDVGAICENLDGKLPNDKCVWRACVFRELLVIISNVRCIGNC